MPTSTNDVWRVTAKMSLDDNDIQNVYHILWSGLVAESDDDLLDDVGDWLDAAYDEIDAHLPNVLNFDSIVAYNISEDYYVGEIDWPALAAGGAGDMLPIQTAAIVLFPTAFLRSQGRKFLPPASLSSIDTDGTPTAAMLTTMGAFAADIVAQYAPAGYALQAGSYNYTYELFRDFTDSLVPNYFATQRRRYRGRGS